MLYKNKRYCKFVMAFLPLGMLANVLAMLFRETLPDFWKGYLEGVAIVAMLFGFVHIIISRRNNINPYTGEPIQKD